MKRDDFVAMVDRDFDVIRKINAEKGHDYAGDEDALANFKIQATECGLTPEQVWGVLAGKHWTAVRTFIREGQVASEPIEGRLHDMILYCFLLLGLVREGQERGAR